MLLISANRNFVARLRYNQNQPWPVFLKNVKVMGNRE
jgi:hypothetical protein